MTTVVELDPELALLYQERGLAWSLRMPTRLANFQAKKLIQRLHQLRTTIGP
jgi:hypothetical protein